MFWQNAYASTISLPQASTIAVRVDALHDFLWWLSVISLGATTIALLVFTYKYHRSQKGRETAYILGSHTLETAWTVIPLIFMLSIFAWGYRDYLFMRSFDHKDAIEVNVLARQWMFNFEYANGRKTLNELYVPKGKPVKLIMTSEDVIHSFFIPNFRTKMDVVPGMYTYLWFDATMVGEHPIRCGVMCGTGHSDMLGKAIVLEQKDYDSWYETGKLSAAAKEYLPEAAKKTNPANWGDRGMFMKTAATTQPLATGAVSDSSSPVMRGKLLFEGKGCTACHSVDGTRKIGPSLAKIFGHEQELEGGAKVTVDENYIRQSLMEPQSQIAKGYPPSMPTFKGLLDDKELTAIIEYIKSLK
jgi:cytochrome c oxidase subunit 2